VGSEEQHGTMIIAKESIYDLFVFFQVLPTNFLHALNQIQNLKALAYWVCMTNLGLG